MAEHNSIFWAEMYGAKVVPILAYQPDPNTSHENFYYNSIENSLYRLEKIFDCDGNVVKKVWIKIEK